VATASLRKVLLVDALTLANRAKSDFLASVSHDLRTPLSIITGYAQLLQEETFGPLTPEQADTLGRILRTASDQLGLISDLLDLARIEQGKLAWTPQPMAVARLVPPLLVQSAVSVRLPRLLFFDLPGVLGGRRIHVAVRIPGPHAGDQFMERRCVGHLTAPAD
jgi:signal transduction histidine kinase